MEGGESDLKRVRRGGEKNEKDEERIGEKDGETVSGWSGRKWSCHCRPEQTRASPPSIGQKNNSNKLKTNLCTGMFSGALDKQTIKLTNNEETGKVELPLSTRAGLASPPSSGQKTIQTS